VADTDQSKGPASPHVWRRVMIGLVYYGTPNHFSSANFARDRPEGCAALCRKENLKADFRVEGNPFGGVTIRDLHALRLSFANRIIDIDYLYLDYSFIRFATCLRIIR